MDEVVPGGTLAPWQAHTRLRIGGGVEEEERGERRKARAKAAPVLRKKRSGMGCWPWALGVADNKYGS